jgi:hypothetical protein
MLVGVVVSGAFAAERLSCPTITENKRPALVFVEGPVDQSHLYAAWLDGRTLRREKIISGRYLEVTQLDNAVFLVTVMDSHASGQVYAADLGAGVMKFIADGTQTHCIRSEPNRKVAMLMEADASGTKTRLIELNLVTLDATLRYQLSRQILGADLLFIGPDVRLSPDFRHIAYCWKQGPLRVERWSQYELRLLDLSTMEVQVLDPNVGVQISASSSFACGRPPFEWISDKDIVYLDMASNEPDVISTYAREAVGIFKVVDIQTTNITESFRRVLPLTLDGGSLRTNPLNGRLLYDDRHFLDLKKNTLDAKNLPFSVVSDFSSRKTQVLNGVDVLYSGSAYCVGSCLSACGGNFAYALRERTESLGVTLYAKMRHRAEPLKVGEGPYLPTRPIGWIE